MPNVSPMVLCRGLWLPVRWNRSEPASGNKKAIIEKGGSKEFAVNVDFSNQPEHWLITDILEEFLHAVQSYSYSAVRGELGGCVAKLSLVCLALMA